MSTWHYMLNGAQAGPVTTDELAVLLTAGTIKGDTLVWRQGLAAWTPVAQIPELAAAAPAASSLVQTESPAAPSVVTAETGDVEKNKVFGVISYLPPLLFIVPLVAARESKFAMYHCNQGAILTIVAFVAWIAAMICSWVLIFIPIIGWLLSMLIHLGLFIGLAALALIGLLNAANGRCKPLPLIGNLFTLIK